MEGNVDDERQDHGEEQEGEQGPEKVAEAMAVAVGAAAPRLAGVSRALLFVDHDVCYVGSKNGRYEI